MPLSETDIAEGLLTRRAAAQFIGCSERTLDRMIMAGELEAVRIRNTVRVSRAACVAALNRTSTVANRRGRPRKGAA